MDLSLDLAGRRVLVFGTARPARRVLARYLASGATVYLASPPVDGHSPGRPSPQVRPVEYPHFPHGWRDLVSAVDLVVLVDVSPGTERIVVAACATVRVWLVREPAASVAALGHVTLVGGGPGDGGLLTVAAIQALRDADVVFFDRLGPNDRLDEWCPGAEQVNVGKTPGYHAVSQAEIERMLVASARSGQTVVRLKGGDPFVFGRGGEEVIACRKAGVTVTVISGVTSAISVPAAAGIPVTHREVSRLFTVLSAHTPLDEEELRHLVGLGGTIVVLMGIGTLPHLAAGLARHGMAGSMPVAVIERGFSIQQRTTVARLDTVTAVAGQLGVRSPAVVVIGEVVRLSQNEATIADGLEGLELLHHAADLARQQT
ncbi:MULTISPECIES: uroporphyrinogen-III C-methyltransferase [Cryobacterium]|uniref:uroporphyrinogen-III C-methyltransferase n=1 Tax=Cryobacterium breve TaxID=1259258 RepID=A0ABY2J9G7_9MICO|nr:MULTISPECIES: uroporphyrinogen-III C-methyltransferase [Cryobacterium]TFC92782.1 uroporphyrinogen-III C-methyltransferase [Cryobacterium sp. TmT3-12]TFD01598.1 uroporphyrinogen-III C-methyltransferase [Cryobacterium breve]